MKKKTYQEEARAVAIVRTFLGVCGGTPTLEAFLRIISLSHSSTRRKGIETHIYGSDIPPRITNTSLGLIILTIRCVP